MDEEYKKKSNKLRKFVIEHFNEYEIIQVYEIFKMPEIRHYDLKSFKNEIKQFPDKKIYYGVLDDLDEYTIYYLEDRRLVHKLSILL